MDEEDDVNDYVDDLDLLWEGPPRTNGGPTADASELAPGKLVVLLVGKGEEDNFTFWVDGTPLWLGVVSTIETSRAFTFADCKLLRLV